MCDRLLQFLLSDASSGVSEKRSFQLMEALLYRVHLNLFAGRLESALAILQVRRRWSWFSFGEDAESPFCLCAERFETGLR